MGTSRSVPGTAMATAVEAAAAAPVWPRAPLPPPKLHHFWCSGCSGCRAAGNGCGGGGGRSAALAAAAAPRLQDAARATRPLLRA